MSDVFKDVEPMVYKSRINVPYHWWAGDTASRFFISLRDDQKILATKCAKCRKVFLPPRKTCPVCFTPNEQWVEVSSSGVVESFTVARRQRASMTKKAPVIYALIKLKGADTSLLHVIEEVKPEAVKIGMKVEAKFSQQRKGNIFDIEYFRPVE